MINQKPYKACKPINTINKIRNILGDLDIFLKEESFKHGQFYSCSIIIACDGISDIDIRTNGKGTNLQYAFASAYAEFVERLQNYFIFDNMEYAVRKNLINQKNSALLTRLEKEDLILDFNFDPTEKYLSIDIALDTNLDVLQNIFHIEGKEELARFIKDDLAFEESAHVPFYNVFSKEKEYLPIDFIILGCGSNGMCAGNTPKEAIIQGMSEIFERYAANQIYDKRITPPTIPHEAVRGTKIHTMIKEIEEESKLKIILKDCSLSAGLPVMGVIILDPSENRFAFKLGSDPSPFIAIERCLTELHQSSEGVFYTGIDLQESFKNHYKDIPEDDLYFMNKWKISKNGTGLWPAFIFNETFSYEFKGLELRYGKDDDDDIKYYLNLIKKNNKKIYVRDVSFLGFNSYFIYIPGLSEQSTHKNNYLIFNDLSKILRVLLNIKDSNNKELQSLYKTLQKRYEYLRFCENRVYNCFLYNVNKDLQELDIELLMTMLGYKLRNYSGALDYMNKFLEGKKPENTLYFYCIRDLLFMLKEGCSETQIHERLKIIYNDELVSEVLEDMHNPEDVFRYNELPHCFNCEKCEISDSCKYFDVLKVNKKVQRMHMENTIDQSLLESIFN